MKKVLIAVLALACFAGGANAQSPSRQKFEQVFFRAQVAANSPSVWDSMVTKRVGAAGASSVLDTTVAISTDGWDVPRNQALSDTAGAFCTLIVYDAADGDCESGADSLSVAMQVSADGITWANVNVFVGGTTGQTTTSRNDQTIVTGIFQGRLSVNGAALAAGQPIWIWRYKTRSVFRHDLNDFGNVTMWPYIRFVLAFHDAKGYMVSAKIARLSTKD